MDREEIYEMVIREMTETAVRERNEQSSEEQELQDKVARLSKEMQEKIKDLPEDVKKAITDYVEATLLAADHDCLYLYAVVRQIICTYILHIKCACISDGMDKHSKFLHLFAQLF